MKHNQITLGHGPHKANMFARIACGHLVVTGDECLFFVTDMQIVLEMDVTGISLIAARGWH